MSQQQEGSQLNRRALLCTASGVIAASMVGSAKAVAPLSPVVSTRAGQVVGLTDGDVYVYKGLRYGASPVGALRFKPPQPVQSWSAIKTAFDFGAPAMQMSMGQSEDPATLLNATLSQMFTVTTDMSRDNEDCLFLNIWSKGVGSRKARPVMVWLHGGGFANGSAAWPYYDGTHLARSGDVVVVTLTHRLNAFGYLYLPELMGEEFATSGNVGMLDIVQALQWVRDNIAEFGGDPGNVTIFGQSGGGGKVAHLLAMPSARGLFQKAIIESWPSLRGGQRHESTEVARKILKELAIAPGNITALQAVTADALVTAAHAVTLRTRTPMKADLPISFSPVVDGVVLPRDPFTPDAPAISSNVPLLIGCTKDEASLFNFGAPWWGHVTDDELIAKARAFVGDRADALVAAVRATYPSYSPTYILNYVLGSAFLEATLKMAERKTAQRAPVFLYYFAWDSPVENGLFKAPHGNEIPLVFDNVEMSRALLGPGSEPQALARQMSSAWVAFATSGDPSNEHIPHWKRFDTKTRSTMVFDTNSQLDSDPIRAIRLALMKS